MDAYGCNQRVCRTPHLPTPPPVHVVLRTEQVEDHCLEQLRDPAGARATLGPRFCILLVGDDCSVGDTGVGRSNGGFSPLLRVMEELSQAYCLRLHSSPPAPNGDLIKHLELLSCE